MKVRNVHERRMNTSLAEAGKLLDSLSSATDNLWPHETWPPMRFDKPLQPGATGGHGPVRYFVKSCEPGKNVYFEFTAPTGFNGFHGFELEEVDANCTVLRHVLEMNARGPALFTWPLVFRPLHDALLEDSLDKAEENLGFTPAGASWSAWVKFLRWTLRKIQSPRNSRKRGR